jgi:hypothetical protein
MILRRITANFRRQDWTAVAVELVIVVLGVFIGLQAQEWATAHAEQQRANVLLQQLRGDLGSERIDLKTYMDYQQVTADYARTAIKGLESPGSVDPATWIASAYQASQILTTQSTRATFDEMKSTGAIDLIRNARLRAMLISYYSYDWSQASTMKAEAPYRELVRSILPYAIQKAIKASCGDRVEIIGNRLLTRLPKTCHIDAPAETIERAAESLRATPGLLPALTYQLSLTETNIDTIPAVQQQLADVIAAADKGGGGN